LRIRDCLRNPDYWRGVSPHIDNMMLRSVAANRSLGINDTVTTASYWCTMGFYSSHASVMKVVEHDRSKPWSDIGDAVIEVADSCKTAALLFEPFARSVCQELYIMHIRNLCAVSRRINYSDSSEFKDPHPPPSH
jgi:hypothetical protein